MSRIPDQLMARLHEANEHLRHARRRLDGVDMFGTDESHAAARELREAEREVEDVTREIDALLPAAKPGDVGGA
jgi:hypothetical protein